MDASAPPTKIPLPRLRHAEADHCQDPVKGVWRSVVRAGGNVIHRLVSPSLEEACDSTCDWVTSTLGSRVAVRHLCHGQPMELLTMAAEQRSREPGPAPSIRVRPSS